MREIDIKGWYLNDHVIGIICPDVDAENIGIVSDKVWRSVRNALTPKAADRIRISCIPFPQQKDDQGNGQLPQDQDPQSLYPELAKAPLALRCERVFKRTLDIAGSLALLCLTAPLWIVIALVIRLSSAGPVLFRQQRVGLGGQPFTFLKFRSMYVNNDHSIHQQYVTNFIKAQNSLVSSETGKFKITNDPRVTPIGRFIRKTSLDELPQLINVLTGEMSLVGPRPPIPYEVREYDVWHRRRVMEIKPGITGIWQVYGRSTTTFDAMVRMDIRYIENWSIWMDLGLLLRTPLAVFAAKGAY
jgi:exopolysaccharide biosynthesis polyprenyl glycosylphosphotransferase